MACPEFWPKHHHHLWTKQCPSRGSWRWWWWRCHAGRHQAAPHARVRMRTHVNGEEHADEGGQEERRKEELVPQHLHHGACAHACMCTRMCQCTGSSACAWPAQMFFPAAYKHAGRRASRQARPLRDSWAVGGSAPHL